MLGIAHDKIIRTSLQGDICLDCLQRLSNAANCGPDWTWDGSNDKKLLTAIAPDDDKFAHLKALVWSMLPFAVLHNVSVCM